MLWLVSGRLLMDMVQYGSLRWDLKHDCGILKMMSSLLDQDIWGLWSRSHSYSGKYGQLPQSKNVQHAVWLVWYGADMGCLTPMVWSI